MGKMDTYAFYTLDKPGFITGGFDEKKHGAIFPFVRNANYPLKKERSF